MFKFMKKVFPKKHGFTDEDYERDYEQKSKALESILGKADELVWHAIIPYAVGGPVDIYCYSHHIKGTAFVTMEVLEPDGNGPLPNRLGTYELIAFTHYENNEYKPHDKENIKDTEFSKALLRDRHILTSIARYSTSAILNPKDTIEIPDDNENICLITDLYQPSGKEFVIDGRKHHLLLCMEVFRKEMEFAMENGTDQLLNKLKNAGYYPYSDLDRASVV